MRCDVSNVIKLERVKWQFKSCEHKQCEVDVRKNELTCLSCGARINPVWYLDMLSEAWDRTSTGNEARRELIKTIEERNRCKCTHCGKMTKIIRNAN